MMPPPTVVLGLKLPVIAHDPSRSDIARLIEMRDIGVTGFEPATSWSQTRRSTKLSYTPATGDT
jgi:hypothetical protein